MCSETKRFAQSVVEQIIQVTISLEEYPFFMWYREHYIFFFDFASPEWNSGQFNMFNPRDIPERDKGW